MQFRHPELLFALLLLIIPILIHLFQLRKFKKEAFTNIKFLQKVSLQTRKSSQLKKWLVLCTRLLALASVILAFAQPFSIASKDVLQEQETIIYLDNSYSMQARGTKGRLLERNVQALLESIPEDANFSLFTNNNIYKNITKETANQELQQITYTPQELNFNAVKLRAGTEFSTHSNSKKDLIIISDFQKTKGNPEFDETNFHTYLVNARAENPNNVAIDSVFIKTQNAEEILLNVALSSTQTAVENLPISVYNNDDLIAKTSVSFTEKNSATAEFSLAPNTTITGSVRIEDSNLQFDNRLYFSIQKPEPVQVIAINEADDSFLKRIYRAPEFTLQSFKSNALDYNALSTANFVVLNQLENLSPSLQNNLINLAKNDVVFLIIPSPNANLEQYNSFLRNLQLPVFQQKIDEEKRITQISFSHPIYEGVFDDEVSNFDYPRVQSFYDVEGGVSAVLQYEDQRPFLLQKNNLFVITAPIHSDNSNFKNAPLIVPTLFNIGQTALKKHELYYILGEENTIDIPVNVGKDEILKIAGETSSFIPRQQSFANKVSIFTQELPEKPGNFSVLKSEENIAQLSFNINRNQSKLVYSETENLKNTTITTGIAEVFENIQENNSINELWKLFVISALLFLLAEMLLLKFLK